MGLKMVHTGDIHLGAVIRGMTSGTEVYKRRIMDFLENLKRIAEFSVKNECDFLLISGDIFHSLHPSAFILDEFAKILRFVSNKGVKVVAIPGNHDMPKTAGVPSYLDAIFDAGVPNFYYFSRAGTITLSGRDPTRTVKFICIPYLPPQIERQKMEEALERFVKREASDRENSDYIVVLSHILVHGAILDAYGRRMKEMGDVEFSTSALLTSEVSYVALGHVHQHQEVAKKVVYCGSIERVDFGEEEGDKGFYLVEERCGDLEYEFIKLQTRPLITIPGRRSGIGGEYLNLAVSDQPSRALLEFLKNARIESESIVRIRYLIRSDQVLNLKPIEEFLEEVKRVMHYILDPTYITIISHNEVYEDIAAKSLREYFIEYIDAQNLPPEINKEKLKELGLEYIQRKIEEEEYG